MNFNEIFKALMSAVEDENMTVLVIILIAIVVLFGANIILGTRIGSKEEGFDFKKFLFGIEKAITMSLITMAVCYAFNLLCIGIGKAGFLTVNSQFIGGVEIVSVALAYGIDLALEVKEKIKSYRELKYISYDDVKPNEVNDYYVDEAQG